MNQSRLEHLLEFYNEDPGDPFNIYALANEYKSFDQKKALKYFKILIEKHPNYIATYYHLAHLYIDLGEEQNEQTFKLFCAAANISNVVGDSGSMCHGTGSLPACG